MLRALVLLTVVAAGGCGPTVASPVKCPESSGPEPSLGEGPVPALLKGHYEVMTLAPKGHPPAPPEAYLLPPEERQKCAYVRIVMSFEQQSLTVRYDALCVEPEDRSKIPVPLKWCSTEGVMHVEWDIQAFVLPVAAGTRSNVQQIASYPPGHGPTERAQERTLWGCKFNLDAQRFEIVSKTDEEVRLRAPKYDAEWVLKPTNVPNIDPDEVMDAVSGVIHPPGATPAPVPVPSPAPGPSPRAVPSPPRPKAVHAGDDKF